MNTLDCDRWKKVERLADKMTYSLELITRIKPEFKGWLENGQTGVLPELMSILWELADDADVIEAKELFKNIANTRTDRALFKP